MAIWVGPVRKEDHFFMVKYIYEKDVLRWIHTFTINLQWSPVAQEFPKILEKKGWSSNLAVTHKHTIV